MKNRSILCGIVLLMFILTSCAGNAPASMPDSDAVATAVATMLAGIPTATPLPEPTITLTPEPQTLLPRSLYYEVGGADGTNKIYRLDRDGITTTLIASEQGLITLFEISPVNYMIAYLIQGDLIVMDSNGENRKVLAQGVKNNFAPVWAPDGKSIVFDDGGSVVLYSLDTGNNEVLIPSTGTDENWPVSFSPNGEKLITRKWVGITSVVSIYDINSRTSMPMAERDCESADTTWNTPGTFLCYKYVFAGPGSPGLWQVNAVDGSVETLIFSDTCPPCSSVSAPRQDSDGKLYYLYGEVDNVNNTYPAVSLVTSKANDINDRVVLRPEKFNVSYVLWMPDGSALLIAQNNEVRSTPTNLILVPVDQSLPIVTIMADASDLNPNSLRWGP